MSDRSPMSVSRLLGLGLTPGKLRGLQRICNANGTLTMVATDQNSSMINMMKDALKREPTYNEVVDAKIALTDALAPSCSAILVDAYYGIWNTIASFHLPKETGVLVRVEKSGGGKNAVNAPLGAIEPGWSVAKIKRIGADAVKLLAQFEPTEPDSAEHQFAFVQQIYEECRRNDILFLLEPVSFPIGDEKKTSKSYLDRKAQTVIESAHYLSRYCDVFKAEFPGTFGHESDAQLRKNLEALNAACTKPWVLLSAGVDFPDYFKQVDMAMEAGASGILGGRAFWKEYFQQGDAKAREAFAKSECVKRVKQTDELVQKKGAPWFKRYGLTLEQLHSMRAVEHWHYEYSECGAPTGPVRPRGGAAPAPKAAKDQVY
ncbi:MAG: tagatose 1,6-diphosphate aldolase [Gemmataceae bacterium]